MPLAPTAGGRTPNCASIDVHQPTLAEARAPAAPQLPRCAATTTTSVQRRQNKKRIAARSRTIRALAIGDGVASRPCCSSYSVPQSTEPSVSVAGSSPWLRIGRSTREYSGAADRALRIWTTVARGVPARRCRALSYFRWLSLGWRAPIDASTREREGCVRSLCHILSSYGTSSTSTSMTMGVPRDRGTMNE